jgi:peptidoglycan hydrolase-like protein with peptidoglycan-binding domain
VPIAAAVGTLRDARADLVIDGRAVAGTIDGKLGRTSRNAVHAFQLAEGIQPADGFATKEVLARLRGK